MQVINKSQRNYFLIAFICCLGLSLHAQENADSIVIKYLRTKPDIPAPFLRVEKKGAHKGLRSQNFFNEPNTPIKVDSILISTYLFGSASSHDRKYFLIRITRSNSSIYKIIDDDNIEQAINNFLAFIQLYKVPNSQKAQLINQLTYAYY